MSPVTVARFIQLITSKTLTRPVFTAWYQCVCQHAPSGMVVGVQATDQHGRPTMVQLVHRTCERRHCYLVPLSRDLGAAEVEVIVRAFAAVHATLDFEVETSETRLIAREYGEIPLDAARYAMLCMALAKQQHEEWVRERSDAGWRYGTKFDSHARTHPLLRPWDQVPERFKKPNLRLPQTMLDLLHQHGYSVVPRETLDRLLRQVQSNVTMR